MENYINSILGQEMEITKIIDYEGYLYVFYKSKLFSNPYNDERLNLVSQFGPLKIDKLTKGYEFTNIYEFHEKFADNESFFPPEDESKAILDIDDVVMNIKLRKWINWEDFFSLIESKGFSADMIDVYSLNKRDIVEIDVNNEYVQDCIINFLSELKADYKISENNTHFEISQIIKN